MLVALLTLINAGVLIKVSLKEIAITINIFKQLGTNK
jgi:hypothetical protein